MQCLSAFLSASYARRLLSAEWQKIGALLSTVNNSTPAKVSTQNHTTWNQTALKAGLAARRAEEVSRVSKKGVKGGRHREREGF
eukprot:scaffold607737_cov20-Prasinocladus_malaysianus.AAC.1